MESRCLSSSYLTPPSAWTIPGDQSLAIKVVSDPTVKLVKGSVSLSSSRVYLILVPLARHMVAKINEANNSELPVGRRLFKD